MIYYERTLWSILVNTPLKLQLRTFKFPVTIGIFAATLGLVLKMMNRQSSFLEHVADFNTSVFISFTGLLALLLVFRTSQATGRFGESVSLVHGMVSDWFDATSTLMSFFRNSKAGEKKVLESKQLVIRLVSLLNALVLEDLESMEKHAVDVSHFELLDVHGIDQASLDALRQVPNRPEVVFCWLQNLLVDLVNAGTVNAPAPLTTRVFQDLGNGFARYHQALKFSDVPVPFPYVAAAEVTLYVHTLVTPIVMCSWFDSGFQVFFFTYILVFPLWSLFVIAGELENPFGNVDINDLNTAVLQKEVNAHLLALVRGPGVAVPNLRYSGEEASRRLDCIDEILLTETDDPDNLSVSQGTLSDTKDMTKSVLVSGHRRRRMNMLRQISMEKRRQSQNDPSPPVELGTQFEGGEPHAHRPADMPTLPQSGSCGDGWDGPGETSTTPPESHLTMADLDQPGSTRNEAGSTQARGSGVSVFEI